MDVRSRSQGLDRLDSHLSGHAAIGPRQSRLCLGRRNAVRARRARCVFRCRPCVSLRSWAKFSARWAEFFICISLIEVSVSYCYTGDVLGDFFEFDPSSGMWTALASASAPTAMFGHGFQAAGSRLYTHGGFDGSGQCDFSSLVGACTFMYRSLLDILIS